ncbi:MAG TPA: flavodoxin family protein [Candidatus Omnitrophota bacterium]|mgnify:CR=1 FL=1|nr:flavodoxin family protein [Candidatus Omnitrophota bacterium]HPM42492.1 flavodoxin family protein [Candidatus Omnitrophota bacterium]
MKVTAIVGTYRKGGITDTAVDEVLASAKDAGADVSKVYLLDKHIEFCTNCRACTQKPGIKRGECPIRDDMDAVLDEIEGSDAFVFASPVNDYTVTALMKRFIERLLPYAYWPWEGRAPVLRDRKKNKRAVVITGTAAPAAFSRSSSNAVFLLKLTAEVFGARTIGVLFMGLTAQKPKQQLNPMHARKARLFGKKLAA